MILYTASEHEEVNELLTELGVGGQWIGRWMSREGSREVVEFLVDSDDDMVRYPWDASCGIPLSGYGKVWMTQEIDLETARESAMNDLSVGDAIYVPSKKLVGIVDSFSIHGMYIRGMSGRVYWASYRAQYLKD